MAAKAVELVQLVGSVARTCSHLPEMKSANNHKRLKQRKQCSQDEFGRYLKKKKSTKRNLAVAVSSSLQPVQEKW